MAITYIEVDTDQLKRDNQELIDNTAKARTCLNNLKEEMEEMNAMWSGKANLAFRMQIDSDYRFLESILEIMDKLSDSIDNAGKEYVKCENEVLSTVNSINI